MFAGMIVVMLVCGGFMLYMHKDGMMMSHDKHEMKTEESKTVPNKTDEGNKNHPEDHKHTH
jgi:hypothetical protein